MIKVIRHGLKRRATCTECGCVFLGDKEDVMPRKGYYCMYCPDCGQPCTVEPYVNALKKNRSTK